MEIIESISNEPTGMENPGFVIQHEIESGVGSSSSDLTPSGTLANVTEKKCELGNYPLTDYQKGNMFQKPNRIAVSVESGSKSYGSLKVLINVNMTVQEGNIYGLLGSSGCGKTTILSSLVGLGRLDSGRILICGKPPGSRGSGVPGRVVGYMPQEIALNGEFTIREVCHFFAHLYGMNKEKVEDRVDYLVALLDLKSCKAEIKNLSGGQKRRASFLVALLHEPEILILDEPTVGVDPVLRANIWTHLRDLVDRCGTTVIITTHYIEEMRQSDVVGIMRNGVIMVENSPQELMETHNSNMLENVVLQYCLRNEATNDELGGNLNGRLKNQNNISEKITLGNLSKRLSESKNYGTPGRYVVNEQDSTLENQGRRNTLFQQMVPYLNHNDSQSTQTHALHRIQALTLKNCIVLWRNIWFLLLIFIMPSLMIGLFCFAIGNNPKGLGLGLIIEENTPCDLQKDHLQSCSSKGLSCVFVDSLRVFKAFDLYFYDNEASGLEAVDNGKIWGFLHFGPSFSQHIYDRTLGIRNTNETIQGSEILVRLDMSTITAGQVIQKLIFEGYRVFVTKLLGKCNIEITGKDLPIKIGDPIYGGINDEFKFYMAPGVSLGYVSFFSALTCGLAFITEKKDGMILRTKVAGVTTIDIMLSHLFPQIGILIVQTTLSFLLMFVVFDIPQLGSTILAFLLQIFYSSSNIWLGFMAATIFDEEKHAMLFSIGALFPTFVLAGMLWPTETLPPIIGKISIVFPGALAAEGMRSILLRGWGMSHYAVYIGFLSTIVYIMFYIATTAIILKIRK